MTRFHVKKIPDTPDKWVYLSHREGATVGYHYTNRKALRIILESMRLEPSTIDTQYGIGQYFTEITPGTRSNEDLVREFKGGIGYADYTYFIEVDLTGLTVFRGRDHVFVRPGTGALDLTGKIRDFGANTESQRILPRSNHHPLFRPRKRPRLQNSSPFLEVFRDSDSD